MRGDHERVVLLQDADDGPPPHARGSLPAAPCGRSPLRPTPACAGITPRHPSRAPGHPAHPRMRGDHRRRHPKPCTNGGPPPHARGSHRRPASCLPRPRPTPACAGITGSPSTMLKALTAHPRMRGDHEGSGWHEAHVGGPPPHARGSHGGGRPGDGGLGPTPACAGITSKYGAAASRAAAHPRMRGDHEDGIHERPEGPGPPPHARGSLQGQALELPLGRPTPACAGITWSRSRRCTAAWAHPRMRGDHAFMLALPDPARGPPPHARGSRASASSSSASTRPTPACAGITLTKGSGGPVDAAHPRMRGDHRHRSRYDARHPGPPPHARGSLPWRPPCAL